MAPASESLSSPTGRNAYNCIIDSGHFLGRYLHSPLHRLCRRCCCGDHEETTPTCATLRSRRPLPLPVNAGRQLVTVLLVGFGRENASRTGDEDTNSLEGVAPPVPAGVRRPGSHQPVVRCSANEAAACVVQHQDALARGVSRVDSEVVFGQGNEAGRALQAHSLFALTGSVLEIPVRLNEESMPFWW